MTQAKHKYKITFTHAWGGGERHVEIYANNYDEAWSEAKNIERDNEYLTEINLLERANLN